MFTKHEKGQAAVILAVALVALLAFAALAIDAGAAYAARREAQNAADAAAMAGARQVVLECGKENPNATEILNQVQKLSSANTEGTTEASYLIDQGDPVAINPLSPVPCGCGAGRAIGVQAVVEKDNPSFFAIVFGRSSTKVKVEARAAFGSVTNVSEGLYPLTRRNIPLAFDQVFQLRLLDKDVDTLPGAFGWLTWDGQNNVPALETSLEPPGNSNIYYNPGTPENGWTANYDDHLIAVGKWVQGAPGNKNSSQVRDQLDDHFLPQPDRTPDDHPTRNIMVIPFYDAVANQGSNANYRVASFAAYWLEAYDFQGNDKYATGKFVRWVTDGDWDPTVSCEVEGGMYSIKLVP